LAFFNVALFANNARNLFGKGVVAEQHIKFFEEFLANIPNHRKSMEEKCKSEY